MSWILTLGVFVGVTYLAFKSQNIDNPISPLKSGILLAFGRTVWSIILTSLIFLCVKGYGGPINAFLSSPYWLPLARLSYALYIVHMPFMLIITASARKSVYFSEQSAVSWDHLVFNIKEYQYFRLISVYEILR